MVSVVYGRRREKRTDNFAILLKNGGELPHSRTLARRGARHFVRAAVVNPNAPVGRQRRAGTAHPTSVFPPPPGTGITNARVTGGAFPLTVL